MCVPGMNGHVSFAACNGHMQILIWARNNGCPCSENTIIHAARSGHVGIVKLLLTDYATYDPNILEECARAAIRGRQCRVLEWLE